MEPEISLPYSQLPATRPYPEPTPSSLHPLPLPEDPSLLFYLLFKIIPLLIQILFREINYFVIGE